jgi:hypothetical protein
LACFPSSFTFRPRASDATTLSFVAAYGDPVKVINTTPYSFLPFECSPTPTHPALTLIVRGTFKIRPDAPAKAKAEADQKPPQGDEQHMDDLGRSLAYASDLVPVKPRGEVLVNAVCHVPDGRPRPSHEVSIQVGPIQKSLHVTGVRIFVVDTFGRAQVGRTSPFVTMPLRWELAFGGMSFAANPLGRGIEPVPDDNGTPVPYLPNIEYANSRMTDPKDRPLPAGLGPIAPSWEPRNKQQGTRDQRWAMFRAPLPPKDFSPAFYNAAPADQQLKERYFRGDEPIVMTGLHRELQKYTTALPGKRLRVFVWVDNKEEVAKTPEAPDGRFVEVEMSLDTVHIDMEKEELVLVWRRPVQVKSREYPELEACYIVEEELASEREPLEVHYARFMELRGPEVKAAGRGAPSVKAPRAEAREVDAAGADADEQTVQAEIATTMAEVKKALRNAQIDPSVVDKLDNTHDLDAIFQTLMSHTEEKIRELEAMAAKVKGG